MKNKLITYRIVNAEGEVVANFTGPKLDKWGQALLCLAIDCTPPCGLTCQEVKP